MKMYVALISSFLLATPAFAQGGPTNVGGDRGADRAPGDARHSGDTNAQGERLICRSILTSSTSRMAARRVCRTAAEWREISRAVRD
jgi:hypothetical protein